MSLHTHELNNVTYVNESRHTHTLRHVTPSTHTRSHLATQSPRYGVATISRLLKIIGLFCRTSSLLQGSSGKETFN